MPFLTSGRLTGVAAASTTPTLVYHFYSAGLSQPASGLSTVALTIRFERVSLSGNCLVLWVCYENGKTITSITDNVGNTWPAAAATSDGGGSNVKLSVFVLPNATAGVQAVTINFSAAVHPAVMYQEYYNVATTTPVAQAKTGTPTGNTIAAAAFSPAPTSGNLILHYGVSANGFIGGQAANDVTSFTKGTGFTWLAASRHTRTSNPWGMQTRLANGGALTATFTAAQASHDNFCTIALELTAATSGTAPATSGIRILKTQFVTGPNAASTAWIEEFPYTGDLIVMRTNHGASATLNTDSQGNTWVWDQQNIGHSIFQHVRPSAASDTYTLTFTSDVITNDTWCFTDIINAKAGNPKGAEVHRTLTVLGGAGGDHQVPSTGDADTGAPTITPTAVGSLILVETSIGHGPMTALLSPTPANALMTCCTYPEETDFDTLNNADGYAVYENGSDLSTVHFVWRWNTSPWNISSNESSEPTAVEYLTA